MNKIIIFGKFDILHPGHISFIKYAQSLGQVTAVLESAEVIYGLRTYHPFYSDKVRQQNLEKLGLEVYLHTNQDKKKILADLKPDIILLGQDQEFLINLFKNTKSAKLKINKLVRPELFKSSKLRSILEDEKAKIYLIDKAKGSNSFKAVAVLRKLLGIKKIGFAGTLDPLASGLMILSSSKATQMLDWFHFLPKVYEADIVFGQTSLTYDLEGEVLVNKHAQSFDKKYLEKKLKTFLGKQEQQVPIYSAVKVEGKKLHQLARAGKEVKAPFKSIEIYDLKIKNFKYPNLKLEVSCSAGTYIRSLAHDLGQLVLGGAMLTGLRRTAIGDFLVSSAANLEELNSKNLADYSARPKKVIESLNQYFYQSHL